MSRLVDNSITIYEAMRKIESGNYLMPSFQRQYVWSMDKIEKLWDSILQGYPISTFLFWHVDNNNVSNDTKFCDFMKNVRFDSSKNADSVNYDSVMIDLDKTDTAVLDGQQRLTSLYISLFGEAGIRQKNQRKNNNTTIRTKLLLQLNKNRIDLQAEVNEKKYDIRFTDKVMRAEPTQFEIRRILSESFSNKDTRGNAIEEAIRNVPNSSKEYAKETLNILCEKIFEEKLIRYTELFEMSHEDALEMFVRFNSGGVKLSKADITMSILESYWPEAKKKIGEILVDDFDGFETDFVIRTAHMIFGDVVKSNISKQVADDLKDNWDKVKNAFQNLSLLIREFKIDIQRFAKSWNVLVPIIFCIYFNENYIECKKGIQTYLKRAVLFTYFQSGTTSKLQKLKNNIVEFNYEITIEMLDQMSEFTVSDAKIEDLLIVEKGSRVAGEVLYYLSLDWIRAGVKYEQDHLHPEDAFSKDHPYGVSIEEWSKWRKMYNTLPNLQYLEGRPNASKQNMSLQDYYDDMTTEQKAEFKKNAFIPEDASLELKKFDDFYTKRKELLKNEIKKILV